MSTETNVVPFNYNGQNLSAVADEQGEIWFVASEVAEILGYAQTNSLNKLLDEDEKRLTTLQIGGNYQNQSLINESGLYNAVFNSTLEGAKAFKKWVTSEVLPTIRKTGQYNTKPNPVAQIDAEIAAAVENMVKALEQANATVAQGKETVKLLVTERRLTLQQEATRQKLLEKAQTKLLLKETEEMTIAEIRQQELLEALRIGKKSALAYQEATGIPIPTTLRDLKKLREQGHDVQVQDTIYGMLYGLFVGGKLMRNYLPED